MANDLLEKEDIKQHPMDRFTEDLLKRSSFKPEEFEHIMPISLIIKKRQLALLGHILRMDENEPERTPTCDKNFIRTQSKNKRKYGPREHWWDANMKLAYDMISEENADVDPLFKDKYVKNDLQQHLAVANWARERLPPFGTGKKNYPTKRN